jgi:hemoglobin
MKTLLSFAFLLLLAAPAWAGDDPLFAELGGRAGIEKFTDKSVDNYLADPRIGALFSESNIDRLRAELKDQFCQVAGGPCIYTGHSMEATHKGLHLKDADFNALVEDLQAAMTDCDVPFAVQNRFLARLAPMERQMVEK